ncbi:hypothetical protein ES703_87572 [subsurface metagenome]
MTGKKSPGKPRPRITDQQISDMLRLRRQGKSISAIARALKCNRQTVRVYLKERQADILAAEVKKQLLTDEQQKHLDDIIQFTLSLVGLLTVPDSLTEDRDVTEILDPLLPKEFPKGLDSASRKARREQRQKDRRNKMLLKSLREHTRKKGWWQAFEEWREAWNTCRDALRELRRQADEVVEKGIKQTPGLKEEVEKRSSKERDEVRRIADDVLWVVWWIGTGSKPAEKLEFRAEEGQVKAFFGDQTRFDLGHRLREVSLGLDMAAVCELAFKTMCQSFSDKSIAEMLHRMNEKIEVIDDALDPFVLHPLLVRTRCELCPV